MSLSANKLLIGTYNRGKVRELRDMLADLDIEICGLDDLPDVVEVEETGSTFAENARLKAVGYAEQSGLVTLADDSGLEVKALGGHPGVLSARYGGVNTTFDEKIGMLLAEVAAADSGRKARFVCSIALASPGGEIVAEVEGVCAGRLADEPSGHEGFGYDPIFIPDGSELTFGELSNAEKAQMSHRGRAFWQIMPILRTFRGFRT